MKYNLSRSSRAIGLTLFLWMCFTGIGNLWAADNIALDKASNEPGNLFIDTVDMDAWNNFEPPRDEKFDWVQLKSGEWLKGELISLYNFHFEFDSDELDLLKIDWEDVRQIRSARVVSLQIEGNGFQEELFTVVGVLQLLEDSAVVITDNQVSTYKRNQIISIARAKKNEADLWKGKIFLGGNVKSGNSDNVDTNMFANATRRTSDSRFVIDYTGNYSSTRNIETSNNHRLNSYYDEFLSKKLFWRIYSAEYYRDTFKNIADQLSLSSSFGYHLIRTPKTEWEVSGGLGVLYKRFVSVEVGEDIENTSPLLIMGTRYDTEITKWMDYLFDYDFVIVDEDSGFYIHHMITTLSSDLVANLDLDISFVWDRVAKPKPAEDGTVPKQDDFQMIIGISYEF